MCQLSKKKKEEEKDKLNVDIGLCTFEECKKGGRMTNSYTETWKLQKISRKTSIA